MEPAAVLALLRVCSSSSCKTHLPGDLADSTSRPASGPDACEIECWPGTDGSEERPASEPCINVTSAVRQSNTEQGSTNAQGSM